MGKGTMNFTSSPGCSHMFPKSKRKGKRGKRKVFGIDVDASSLENT